MSQTFPMFDAAVFVLAVGVLVLLWAYLTWGIFFGGKSPFKKKVSRDKEPLWDEPEYHSDPWVVETIEKLASGEITKDSLTPEQQSQIAGELDQFFYQWTSSCALLAVSYAEAYRADAALK